jgi:hypothetical protein
MHTQLTEETKSQLSEQAPGILGIFGRLFDTPTIHYLTRVYETALAHGGAIEHPVLREDDASFNPRPARIAQIIWTETRCQEALPYALAFLSCCHPEEQAGLSKEFPTEVAQCFPIWQQMAMPDIDTPQLVHDIALAQMLDKARHLHMTDLSESDQREFHHFVVNEIIMCAKPSAQNSITRKLQHWAALWIHQLNNRQA